MFLGFSDGDGEVVHGLHEDRSGLGKENHDQSEGHKGFQALNWAGALQIHLKFQMKGGLASSFSPDLF